MARRRRNRKNQITNVRITDPTAGPDGLKVDRILSNLQNSHSQTRISVNGSILLSTATTGGDQNGVVAAAGIKSFDDFVSVAQQFETCRITAIRIDIYDINPNNIVANAFSTFHDVSSTPYNGFTFQQTIDAPDSFIIPPGSGKASLTWMARGTTENQFQTTAATPSIPAYDFGGFRFTVGQGATAAAKYQIIIKAIVDFRGRY